MLTRVSLATLLLSGAIVFSIVPNASAATRSCGTQGNRADTGGAESIRATNVSCKAARRMAARCLNNRSRSGYTHSTGRSTSRGYQHIFRKGNKKITFYFVGGSSGCI
jgi:hypothetical protein